MHTGAHLPAKPFLSFSLSQLLFLQSLFFLLLHISLSHSPTFSRHFRRCVWLPLTRSLSNNPHLKHQQQTTITDIRTAESIAPCITVPVTLIYDFYYIFLPRKPYPGSTNRQSTCPPFSRPLLSRSSYLARLIASVFILHHSLTALRPFAFQLGTQTVLRFLQGKSTLSRNLNSESNSAVETSSQPFGIRSDRTRTPVLSGKE